MKYICSIHWNFEKLGVFPSFVRSFSKVQCISVAIYISWSFSPLAVPISSVALVLCSCKRGMSQFRDLIQIQTTGKEFLKLLDGFLDCTNGQKATCQYSHRRVEPRCLMFRAVDMDGSDWHSQTYIQMLFSTDSAFGFALKLS